MSSGPALLARTQAFILAGGQGERLQPLTISRPKPAISFGGVFRIIDFTLLNCLSSGLRRVSLVTQYRYEELHRYIREGWSEVWNNTQRSGLSALRLLPPSSGKRYRGTADAVFQNSELLQSDRSEFVLVLSGDHIYRMDYRGFLEQHVESDADLTIATVEHPLHDASHFGVVEADRNYKVTGFQEKPVYPRPMPSNPSMALVSMGVYVFKKSVLLESLRRTCETGLGHDFGRDIIPSLIRSGRTYAYDFRDTIKGSPHYWRDIGTLDAYYEASMDLVRPGAPFDPYAHGDCPLRRRPANSSGLPIADSFIARSILAPDVDIADGVTVYDSVLMPGARVGKGARLRRAIVDEGVHIPAGFQVGFDSDEDRTRHTVTKAGVIVVSRTPENSRPVVVRFARPEAAKRPTQEMRGDATRVNA